jgi:predicted ester cyclase
MASRRRIEEEAAMSQQENLRIIREAFEAWNAHDADRYAALLDEGYVEETHTKPTPVRGREAARAAMREYLRALPDLHFDFDVMITSGDQVFTRWLVTGTYREESMSRPLSGSLAKRCRIHSGWTLHVAAGGTPARFGRWVAAHVARVLWRCLHGPSGAAVTEGVVTVQLHRILHTAPSSDFCNPLRSCEPGPFPRRRLGGATAPGRLLS